MTNRAPIWDVLTDDQKQEAIEAIIAHFQDERDESIGVVAAEELLDVVMQSAFPAAYNKGVVDAQKVLEERLSDAKVDLDALLRK